MTINSQDFATLVIDSGIDPDVIEERGYYSIDEDLSGLTASLIEQIRELAPNFSHVKTRNALFVPMYGVNGKLVSAQLRVRDLPAVNGEKPQRYLSPKDGTNHLDVHPRNVEKIKNTDVRLWITEGVKKGDALTSHGEVAVALTGVFNWRNKLGTLGDWEDIPLKGREVIVCFDSDAATNRDVLLAMGRAGEWLKSKRAKVTYVITPAVEGLDKTGADDFLVSGGTIEQLLSAGTAIKPTGQAADGKFSDSFMSETVAEEVMEGKYRWSEGTGWISWDGRRWQRCAEEIVVNSVKNWAIDRFSTAIKESKGDDARSRGEVIEGWRSVLGRSRLTAIVALTRGIQFFNAADMDADPDILNCQNGVVDLRTGELMPFDHERLISKISGASFDPTAKSDDLDAIISAITPKVAEWLQIRFGQAATGYMTTDDTLVLLQGGGSNGKTTLVDSIGSALGEYHTLVPDALLMGQASDFDKIILQGVRFALIEETPEAAHLDSVRLKKSVGSPEMDGAFKYKDKVVWRATHSLFLTTNYRPVITETDTGTWRRLALVTFPYTYVKGEPTSPHERKGDPRLRDRASKNPEVLSAMLRWIVEGAKKFYDAGEILPEEPPQSMQDDKREWRRESDMILAYWDDRLTASPSSYVSTSDLFKDFCDWMEIRKNRPPSEKLFTPRFRDHSETRTAQVEKRIVRSTKQGISRPRGGANSGPLGAQIAAWLGVKFKDDQDVFEDEKPAFE